MRTEQLGLKKPGEEILKAMTFNEMSKADYLQYCKDAYPDLYNAKFEEQFGHPPGYKPKPQGSKNTPKLDTAMVKKIKGMTFDEVKSAGLMDLLLAMPEIYGEKYKDKFGSYPQNGIGSHLRKRKSGKGK